jgi:EmrB/QacA subfamily drug resistance transporter
MSAKRVLALTTFASFVAFLDVTIANIAFPSIVHSFAGTRLTTLSWVLNAYNVVFAALLVPAGRYADALGHRRTFILGLAVFSAASAAAAAAPSAALLIAARVVQAVGAAVFVPTSVALLLAAYPLERRSTVVGLWGAAAAVAAATGPTLGGLLVDASSWRLVFLVNVPLGLVAIVAARGVREYRSPVRLPHPLDVVLVGAGVGLLALALVQSGDWGWSSARVLGAFAAAAVLLTTFVARTRASRAPAIDLSLFARRGFAVGNVGTVIFAAAFYGMLLVNVLFLTGVWRYSAIEAGLALTPAPMLAAVAAAIAGGIADRRGHRAVVVPGAIVYLLGTLWLIAAMDAEPAYLTHFLPAAVLIGIGVGTAFAPLGAATAADVGPAEFATGGAVNLAARQIGAVLGIAGVVAIVTGGDGAGSVVATFQHAWIAIAIAAGAVAVTGTMLRGHGVAAAVPARAPAAGEAVR